MNKKYEFSQSSIKNTDKSSRVSGKISPHASVLRLVKITHKLISTKTKKFKILEIEMYRKNSRKWSKKPR